MSAAELTGSQVYTPPAQVTLRACLIWTLGALFYFYEFILQISPSVMIPDLMRSFGVHAEAIGSLSAYYFYAYALMQIPVGLLMDKFGPRKLLTFAGTLCAVGSMVFANAETLMLAQIGRMMMGLGGSFAVVGCLKLASLWFPANRFALLAGLMVTVGMLGAAAGQAPLAKLIEHIGWRASMADLAYVGVVLSLFIWLIIRDQHQMQLSKAAHNQQIGMFSGLLKVMKSAQTWLAALYAGLMFVPTIAFGELWGVPYLMERFPEITRPSAAATVSVIFFGWMFGGPFFGWLSDKLGLRNAPMAVATVCTIIAMSMILYIKDTPISFVAMSLFLLGFFSSGFVLAFSVVRENHLFILGGTAMGFVNMLNTIGGAIGQPVIGRLLDNQWSGDMIDGIRVFTLDAYENALVALPWCLVVALLLLPFVKETRCKFRVQQPD